MANLKDIAKASGFSLTQVSRALNDYDDVSESTKRKVKQVAQELGYVKNVNASRLASQMSNQISVVIQGFDKLENNEDNILMTILKGVYSFAESIDYEVVPFLVSRKNKQSYLDYCKSRAINGIIFIGARNDDKRYLELVNSDFPAVIMDTPVVGENKACVLIDNEMYAQKAVNELVQRGYKKIGIISGHEFAYVSIGRIQGYKNALLQNGLKIEEKLIKNGDFSFAVAKEKTNELIDEGVDALFIASDIMALGALDAIREQGLNVPKDIAIFGFDGLMSTRFTIPPISTVVQDNYRKGYESAKLLHQILGKETHKNRIYVDCELRITASI